MMRMLIKILEKTKIHERFKSVLPDYLYAQTKYFIIIFILFIPFHKRNRNHFWTSKCQLKENYSPLITILVPNYNHEKFLRQRLDSVYQQTYQNFNVILLDDCSTDNSSEILKEYHGKYPEKTILLLNDANAGSPFSQWKKGIEAATGELIWIAESDDYCDANFLAELVVFFQDETVKLAFADSLFVKNGKVIGSLKGYMADLNTTLFTAPFLQTAHICVNQTFGLKNIIPNVSSCIFRNPGNFELFADQEWQKMRVCGDWIFYLHLIRGGVLAFTNKTRNYYRQHENNTSVKTQKTNLYYQEHEAVARHVAALYKVSPGWLTEFQARLKSFWKLNRDDYNDELFHQCFDRALVMQCAEKRKRNIAMCCSAFSVGGGEIVPITLANELYRTGNAITFINFEYVQTVPGVRSLLSPSIPVWNLNWNFNQFNENLLLLGIEIIHTHHAVVDFSVAFHKSPSIVHAVTLHGMYEAIAENTLRYILPTLKKRVDLWFYIARKNLFLFEKYNVADAGRIFHITNGLPRSEIHAIERSTLGIPEDAFVLCLVSRAFPAKGWEEAISAVSLARKTSQREIRLLLIGDGEEYDRLKRTSPQGVIFLGYQKDTRAYFAMSDMGFLPSRYPGECQPLVIIDSFFAGKPVLASDIGEIPKMLTTKDGKTAGRIFKLNNMQIDIQDLSAHIVRCANDNPLYLEMSSAVKDAASSFEIDHVAKQYEEIFEKVYREINGSSTAFPPRMSEKR